jgi:hypothetical protein
MGDRQELQAREAVQIGDQVVLPLVAFLETGLSFFKHHDGIVPRRRQFVKTAKIHSPSRHLTPRSKYIKMPFQDIRKPK